jgi:anthranilate synthase component II
MKILMLDNYDSFTYNLVHYLEAVDENIAVTVKRNDKISLEEVAHFDAIILSPGPGLPKDAGIMPKLIRQYAPSKPILGVCLGHQAIGEAFGSTLKNLDTVYHGLGMSTSILEKDVLFENLPEQFITGRYHSWVIDKTKLSSDLVVTATDDKGEIMALKHKSYNVRGVQFHPESILTEYGKDMIKNWVNACRWQKS